MARPHRFPRGLEELFQARCAESITIIVALTRCSLSLPIEQDLDCQSETVPLWLEADLFLHLGSTSSPRKLKRDGIHTLCTPLIANSRETAIFFGTSQITRPAEVPGQFQQRFRSGLFSFPGLDPLSMSAGLGKMIDRGFTL